MEQVYDIQSKTSVRRIRGSILRQKCCYYKLPQVSSILYNLLIPENGNIQAASCLLKNMMVSCFKIFG